jgi:hypothetical protein
MVWLERRRDSKFTGPDLARFWEEFFKDAGAELKPNRRLG